MPNNYSGQMVVVPLGDDELRALAPFIGDAIVSALVGTP